MSTKEWLLANKVKSALSLVAALAAVIVLPVKLVAYAEDLSATQVREAVVAQQAREEVIHGSLRAKHELDFAKAELEDTEEDLIELEEEVEAGVELTPTQQRKYNRSLKKLEEYEQRVDAAEEQLANPEGHDDGTTETE